MVDLNKEYLIKKFEQEDIIDFTSINIEKSKIRRIDSNSFETLPKLSINILDLNHNEIEKIDLGSFDGLSNLNWLYLADNKLKRIDSNTFKGLANLEGVWLNINEIEKIDLGSFESLSNLKWLYLYSNKLKKIDSNTFKGLTKLEGLSLEFNEIEEIEVGSFECLSNLKSLYLYNNKLKKIDIKCFEQLKSIELILLYENDGLKAQSFIKFPTSKYNYNREKLEKYGSISEWNRFLQQFSESEKLDVKERYRKEREAVAQQRVAEEKPDSAKKPSSSSSSNSNQSTNKERDKNLLDQYIGKFLSDRYEVVKKLGKGAFGLVYLVDDTKIESKKVKQKAMKIMDKFDSATENELELFFEIVHENIVRYFDHFHLNIGDDNQTFLITEYCENGDLKNKIEETKRQNINFSDKQILNWTIQATNALKYLHSKSPDPIIHRDIKPANMLLSGRNEIKLADLGLSKLMDNTHASSHAGSPTYMSPEVFKAQFMRMNYYPNTDIWSLGCVLYELKFLTIAFPKGQFDDPPIPSKVSSSGLFSSILAKMLEKDCLVRISSRRLLTELENLFEDNK